MVWSKIGIVGIIVATIFVVQSMESPDAGATQICDINMQCEPLCGVGKGVCVIIPGSGQRGRCQCIAR